MVTRKNLRTLITFACVIALVLALGSCGKKAEEPPVPPEPNEETKVPDEDTGPQIVELPKVTDDGPKIVPLVGVGPVKFGMSKEEVIRTLGQPERAEGGIALWYLKSRGLSLLMDPARGLREISCWSKEYPDIPEVTEVTTFSGATKEGVAMGAGREQIVSAYGEPDKTSSRGSLEILHYDELRIRFMLAGDRLLSIRMSAPQ